MLVIALFENIVMIVDFSTLKMLCSGVSSHNSVLSYVNFTFCGIVPAFDVSVWAALLRIQIYGGHAPIYSGRSQGSYLDCDD